MSCKVYIYHICYKWSLFSNRNWCPFVILNVDDILSILNDIQHFSRLHRSAFFYEKRSNDSTYFSTKFKGKSWAPDPTKTSHFIDAYVQVVKFSHFSPNCLDMYLALTVWAQVSRENLKLAPYIIISWLTKVAGLWLWT